MWIALEEKFQGSSKNWDGEKGECVITPVINKYTNCTLYDILVNPEVHVRKAKMMILTAFYEGKLKGAKVYPVSDRKKGLSIIKTEAHFQRLL